MARARPLLGDVMRARFGTWRAGVRGSTRSHLRSRWRQGWQMIRQDHTPLKCGAPELPDVARVAEEASARGRVEALLEHGVHPLHGARATAGGTEDLRLAPAVVGVAIGTGHRLAG